MASIRNLKKDINYTFGDIIDAVLIWEFFSGNKNSEEGGKIIEDALSSYDDFMARVNDKKVDHRAKHLKSVNQELEKKANEFVERINKLD